MVDVRQRFAVEGIDRYLAVEPLRTNVLAGAGHPLGVDIEAVHETTVVDVEFRGQLAIATTDMNDQSALDSGRFDDFQFNLSTASDVHTQDLGVLAKHVPNISVAGHWWHTLYPAYIRKAVETRIDMVPMNKIVAFFSDAYHAEWCCPKLRLIKEIWCEVLTERVTRGWMDLPTAEDLIEHAFYLNPKRIYGVE